jgi:hypothetical protein
MATQLDSLGENQFLAVRDINHPRQDLIIDANNLVPYKVYTALLTQSGKGNPPTAIVLENTIGDIVWSYDKAGLYIATLNGAFPNEDKFFTLNYKSMVDQQTYIGLKWQNANTFSVTTAFVTYTPVVGSTLQNSMMSNYPIEIRVYN